MYVYARIYIYLAKNNLFNINHKGDISNNLISSLPFFFLLPYANKNDYTYLLHDREKFCRWGDRIPPQNLVIMTLSKGIRVVGRRMHENVPVNSGMLISHDLVSHLSTRLAVLWSPISIHACVAV